MTTGSPHSGDDTYDLIDDALYQLAERRHKWLGDPLAAITLIASLIDQAERMLPEHALLALDNGATRTTGQAEPPAKFGAGRGRHGPGERPGQGKVRSD